MSRGYRLTPEAQAQLDEMCGFIAEDNVDAALRVLDAFEHAFDQLAASAEIGHTREDLTPRPVKFWSVYSYLVVYDPASAPLGVIAGAARRARHRASPEEPSAMTSAPASISPPNSAGGITGVALRNS